MPYISEVMQNSVRRRGVGDVVMGAILGKRGITDELSSAKSTFSSWDNCMAKTYCKWPVIAGIIVGGLILFSVVWCIIRCACCGMSCCCTCFSFLKCCDCCGGCCDGKKNKPHKHLDDSYGHGLPQQGYQAPVPMMGGGLPPPGPPQYAQFEVGKSGLAIAPTSTPISEDALPPMPSWETATKKHVLTEEERNAVELGDLDPATGQKMPLMAGGAGTGISAPASPVNGMGAMPYGTHPGQAVGSNGYAGVDDPYAQNQGMYNQNSRGYAGDPNSGMTGGYDANYPHEMDGGGGDYGNASPHDPYGNENGLVGAAIGSGYGHPPPQRQYSNDSHRAYAPRPQPSRQYTNDSSRPMNQGQYSDRPYQTDNYQNAPPRGPSRGPDPRNRIASPPMNNGSNFDFGTEHQYSRPSPPPQQSYNSSYAGSTAPPTYASRSPPPQQASGYRAYQAPSAQGRGHEPQNWDPVQR